MPRETKAQKNARISAVLADFDNRSRELNKLTTVVKGLKEQIKEIPVGTYGDWQRSEGTPREILDQREAKRLLAEAGIPVPVRATEPPIVVSPVAGK